MFRRASLVYWPSATNFAQGACFREKRAEAWHHTAGRVSYNPSPLTGEVGSLEPGGGDPPPTHSGGLTLTRPFGPPSTVKGEGL
jgi:hypothetical protein